MDAWLACYSKGSGEEEAMVAGNVPGAMCVGLNGDTNHVLEYHTSECRNCFLDVRLQGLRDISSPARPVWSVGQQEKEPMARVTYSKGKMSEKVIMKLSLLSFHLASSPCIESGAYRGSKHVLHARSM